MKIEEYERAAILKLCIDVLPQSVLQKTLNSPDKIEVKHSGTGYFLDLYNSEIPQGRRVCSKPVLIGKFQGNKVGFVVFVDDGLLTLECHSFEHHEVPEEIRNGVVELSEP